MLLLIHVYGTSATLAWKLGSQLLTFVVSSLYQMTPLHIAAERGFVKIVDYLIDKGADVDIRDKNGVIICGCFNNNVVLL